MVSLKYYDGQINIGDQLAPIVNSWMMQEGSLKDNSVENINLMTIGSILAADFFSGDAVVWGSGIHYVEDAARLSQKFNKRALDIRALRGPITKRALEYAGYMCPDIYGDPAVLLPYIYNPVKQKDEGVSIIRHISMRDNKNPDGLNHIDVETSDYKRVIDNIVNSSMVISSSLHGLILAEAYEVPAVWLVEDYSDEILKYFDWYYSTGRSHIKMARSIEEAIEIGGMPLPNLKKMQAELIDTYPRDIYEQFYEYHEKSILLWGCGECFHKNINKILKYTNVEAVVDNNSAKWGKRICDIECISPSSLKNRSDIYILLMVDETKYIEQILQELPALGIRYYDTYKKWLRRKMYE